MTQLRDDLSLREALGTDLNFIFDTFRESVRHDSTLGKSCRTSIFKREFAKVIDHILHKSKVLVACLKADPNVILGYLIYEPGIIHYIFVKQAFRSLGIAKDLIVKAELHATEFLNCAFKTNSVKFAFEKYPNLIHNPFLNFKQGA